MAMADDVLGPHFPFQTLTSRTATVAYLRTARTSLKSVFSRLMKEAQPRNSYRLA
jgi:hypothetical protein